MEQKHVVLSELVTKIIFSEDGSSVDWLHTIILEYAEKPIRQDHQINHEKTLTEHLHARLHPQPQR
jgi:hypothetical protein